MSSRTVRMPARGTPLVVPGLPAAAVLALMQVTSHQPDARTLPVPTPLDARHVALVATHDDDPSARVFADAALALRVHVTHIAAAELGLLDSTSPAGIARMLGRLYAVVGCAGLDSRTVGLLRRSCGVPVLNNLAAATHASRLLADVMTLLEVWPDLPGLHPQRPRIGVCGPARSGLLRAWRRMAGGVPIEVVDLSAVDADILAAGCHFVCRPGAPPELFAVHGAGAQAAPRETSLAGLQGANHRRVVQAMLQQELSARR